jgi:outer membrane lipoprotein LolB
MSLDRRGWLLAAATLALAGCATPAPPKPIAAGSARAWAGRLALQVEDTQTQSFSAAFELQGLATSGELKLFSPLGGTLARLHWAPGSAVLQQADGQQRVFPSLDALVSAATGTAVPIAALFDWLEGKNTSVPGWQADLTQIGRGRLQARRYEPAPTADLRVVLEQP